MKEIITEWVVIHEQLLCISKFKGKITFNVTVRVMLVLQQKQIKSSTKFGTKARKYNFIFNTNISFLLSYFSAYILLICFPFFVAHTFSTLLLLFFLRVGLYEKRYSCFTRESVLNTIFNYFLIYFLAYFSSVSRWIIHQSTLPSEQ
jgi:hypothetical protein